MLGWLVVGDGVETTFTGASMKNPPRSPILNRKEFRMKFKENIVIGCKSISGNKIFFSVGNMKNILQKERSIWGMNMRLTNM